jgi:hypothetical protein
MHARVVVFVHPARMNQFMDDHDLLLLTRCFLDFARKKNTGEIDLVSPVNQRGTLTMKSIGFEIGLGYGGGDRTCP